MASRKKDPAAMDSIDGTLRPPPRTKTHSIANIDIDKAKGNGMLSLPSGASALSAVSDDAATEQSVFSDEEDYDTLKLDTSSLVAGSSGGGVEKRSSSSRAKMGLKNFSADAETEDDGYVAPDALEGSPLKRRKSVQVKLEKVGKKGRYKITADDPEVREILRRGFEREAAAVVTGDRNQKPRSWLREIMFTRQFTTFDRQNPVSAQSPFHGFFTLFWLAMAGLLVKVSAHNWRIYGSIFGTNEIMRMMFGRDVLVLGISDGVMCASTASGLVLQKLVAKDYIDWRRSGWILQNIWQSLFLTAWIGWTQYREWPWTHTIFLTLHMMVFLMKQHSYAFYNGHLSHIYKRKKLLEKKLETLDHMEPVATPPASPTDSPKASFDTSSFELPISQDLHKRRRRSSGRKSLANIETEKSRVADVAEAIGSGNPLAEDQMDTLKEIIQAEIDGLDEELKGKCTTTENQYPNNLTLYNFMDWTCLPTLVYELEYPRQEIIDWYYVAEKTAATFGIIGIMMVISQAYIYPPVAETVRMKEAGIPLEERMIELPWILSDILFPLLFEQLLTWYLIWECILNVVAEITRFADRGFYGDWWNSVSWDQYARDWNRPVHNFLLRHVYSSSISAFHVSKGTATLITFFLSACVHELLMACLFRKVRGYLFTMQLLQVPLVSLSRTKFLKGRKLLGNIIFWIGLFVGPSFLTSLYLIL